MVSEKEDIKETSSATHKEDIKKTSSGTHTTADQVVINPLKTESADTRYNDEAMIVLAQEHGDDAWSPEEEKRLLRKLDWQLLPILCFTYGLQYYDKAMLSQAAIFGIRTDLDLNVGNRYSFSSAILYIGFLFGSYPCSLLAQKYPIERVAAGLIVVWGVCLMATAACTNYQGLWAQRFLLGLLEGGVSPIFMIVVGGWYRKQEQALRMGAWFCCTGYAGVVSPLINYGLGQIKGTLSPWKYMYLVAGAITIIWAVVVYFFLPPDPIRARGFTPRERYIAVARMQENNTGVRNTHWKGEQVVETVLDVRFWLHFLIALLMMVGNGPYSTFTPIIVQNFGLNPLNTLLLTIPAGFITGCIELGAAYAAYKFKNKRCIIMLCCQVPTVVSCILQWQLPRSNKGGLLFAAYIIASLGGTYAVLLGVVMANSAGYTKRTLNAAGLFIGYCVGNLIGPLLFKPQDAPAYAPAFIGVLATALATMALIAIYWYLAIRDNNIRDEAGIPEGFDHAYEDDLTDRKNPQFRYTT
ncbi:hypothetical protein VF21_07296 [Pseudogymnoascus sp. 05NY08]|nr:hypothetical protein VF21_07296 [Pseudogymnoascus sp. 05NY08]